MVQYAATDLMVGDGLNVQDLCTARLEMKIYKLEEKEKKKSSSGEREFETRPAT